MTNEELVDRIKTGIDVSDNMLQLYNQTKNFIYSVAKKYRGYESIEDLTQEGYLALYDAIAGYDPDTGFKFLTYAAWHFRQRMQRYISSKGSCLRLPAGRLDLIQRYRQFWNQFMVEHGRTPTEQEIAGYMRITEKKAREIKESIRVAKLGSLDSPVVNPDGGGDTVMGDLIADPLIPEEQIIEKFQQEQLKATIWDCVDHLPDRQREIIRRRYQEDMTFSDVADQLNVTSDRIRKDEVKALRELRQPKNSSRLRPYLEDACNDTMPGADQFRQTWAIGT